MKDLFGVKSELTNVVEGTTCLNYRLGRANDRKFLIVLDDVDSQDQLDALLPGIEGILSSGSVVIITTRDKSVFTAADVCTCYKTKPLYRDYAKELFCSHALRQRDPPTAYKRLVESFLDYRGGLPLSLIVLGAHLRGRDERYWALELEKVKRIPPEEIIQRLKISFDVLDEEEKQIFIDIACFFNTKECFQYNRFKDFASPIQSEGHYMENLPILSLWKMYGWNAKHALQTLQEKCLLQVVRDHGCVYFEMHDHLRDLGRQIADELGPPRLWKPDILRSIEAKGFKQILADTKARCYNSLDDCSLGIRVEYFIGGSNDSGETELMWLKIEKLEWRRQLPLWIPLRKLHCLCLRDDVAGNLRKVFQHQIQTNSQASFELRRLLISNSYSLRKLPEFEQLKRLNILQLEGCDVLQNISDISSLTALQSLCVIACFRLEIISDISSLTGLQSLHLERCPRLKTTFSLSSLPVLQSLHVQGCSKCELIFCEEFETVAHLPTLKRITILDCGGLQDGEGFEELREMKSVVIGVPENTNALVRNCNYILRWLEAEIIVLMQNALETILKTILKIILEIILGCEIGASVALFKCCD